MSGKEEMKSKKSREYLTGKFEYFLVKSFSLILATPLIIACTALLIDLIHNTSKSATYSTLKADPIFIVLMVLLTLFGAMTAIVFFKSRYIYIRLWIALFKKYNCVETNRQSPFYLYYLSSFSLG